MLDIGCPTDVQKSEGLLYQLPEYYIKARYLSTPLQIPNRADIIRPH
jgi:hypothetical protein